LHCLAKFLFTAGDSFASLSYLFRLAEQPFLTLCAKCVVLYRVVQLKWSQLTFLLVTF